MAAEVQSPIKVLEPRDVNREKPKKKTEKLSSLCKTPPAVIRNKSGRGFHRGDCLGVGGFARCFQVKDTSGNIYAAKTVAKASLKSESTKVKLLAEIKIHKSLKHPNIVEFVDCFEDDINVYMLLEICSNQSLIDVLKVRKVFTEPETRYLMVQIIGAVSYMHSRRVIHRDLKLGNIFLDENMNAKIGDFGLAALLSDDKDRKKTMCGTPNYMAPEILIKGKGHSFEVDMWAIGIIMYAMLFGKPPFQSRSVDTIYERVKTNDYSFPEDFSVSDAAKDLISDLLSTDPTARPTIDELLNYDFFKGSFPSHLSVLSLSKVPFYRSLTPERSRKNFIAAQMAAQIITLPSEAIGVSTADEDAATASLFKRASRGVSATDEDAAIASLSKRASRVRPIEITRADIKAEKSQNVLPTTLSPASTKDKYKMVMVNKEEVQSLDTKTESRVLRSLSGNTNPRDIGKPRRVETHVSNKPSKLRTSYTSLVNPPPPKTKTGLEKIVAVDEALARELARAHQTTAPVRRGVMNNTPNLYRSPSQPLRPSVVITKWVDYSNKYGVAYEISGKEIGVLFRDKTSIIMDPETEEHQILVLTEPKQSGGQPEWVRQARDGEGMEPADEKRIRLVKAFHKYMQEKLYKVEYVRARGRSGTADMEEEEQERHVYVTSFSREEEYIMFQLSNGSFQFNFPDHCKVIISQDGEQVDVIDSERRWYTWAVSEGIAYAKLHKDKAGVPKYDLITKLETCRRAIENAWMAMA
ncbi:cell cycle serine/threonine-protein kinase Cdc5p/MSD2 [Trichomonascus vanleenenianus]|uniref:polo kinase CDC5 n=1 Tax=Trichomonascus vanleenenianus TaxID=2268995 RepID=UPI003ECB9E58